MFLSPKALNRLILGATVFAFATISYALFSQHILGHEPCVLCIYQRSAMLLVGAAGILTYLIRRYTFLRLLGYCLVITASLWGFYQADIQVGVIAGKAVGSCQFFPTFGPLGPLDEQIPWFFGATGDCNDDRWQFVGLNMPQWTRIIFGTYLITSVLLIIREIVIWIGKYFFCD